MGIERIVREKGSLRREREKEEWMEKDTVREERKMARDGERGHATVKGGMER